MIYFVRHSHRESLEASVSCYNDTDVCTSGPVCAGDA